MADSGALRKLVTRLLIVVAPIAIAVVLTAAARAGAAGADVYGVGGGWIGFTGTPRFIHFAFSAHTGPDGVFGQIEWRTDDALPPLDVTVDVDCVHVEATNPPSAVFSGLVTKASPQPNSLGVMPGQREAFGAVDGGEPSTTPVDTWVPAPFVSPTLICSRAAKLLQEATPDVTQGDVVIKP